MIHVVQLFAVHQQFVRVVQFGQSVSCNSSTVHSSCRSFGSPCRSVAGLVGSVVQPVRTVCLFTVADQQYQLKALVDCWNILPMEQGAYMM